jgi:hypothetical protein
VSRIELIPISRSTPELRAAYQRVNRLWGVRGSPPVGARIMQAFCHRPALVEAAGEGYRYAGWSGTLPRATREMMAVLISRENECFY